MHCICRAIGDVALQPYVTCEPEMIEAEIGPDDLYLVLASDGLWDVLNSDEVARHLVSLKPKDFLSYAQEMCNESLILGSMDNVTVLVIDLR